MPHPSREAREWGSPVQSSASTRHIYDDRITDASVVAVTPNFVQGLLSEVGGADRDRTGDLMLAKHALSQLSYSPIPTW